MTGKSSFDKMPELKARLELNDEDSWVRLVVEDHGKDVLGVSEPDAGVLMVTIKEIQKLMEDARGAISGQVSYFDRCGTKRYALEVRPSVEPGVLGTAQLRDLGIHAILTRCESGTSIWNIWGSLDRIKAYMDSLPKALEEVMQEAEDLYHTETLDVMLSDID